MSIEVYPIRNELDLTLIQLGESRCPPGYSYNQFSRDNYLIHYITSGKGIYICGDKEYSLHEGQAFLITNEKEIFYQADSDDPWYYRWFEICGKTAELFLNKCRLSIDEPVYTARNPDAVNKSIDSLMSVYSNIFAGDISFSGMIECVRVLDTMIDYSMNSAQPPSSHLKKTYVQMAKNYVFMNPSKKISVNDICSNIGIDRTYLYRLFIEYEGKTPKEYIIDYKLHKAKKLISESHYNIGEAAAAVGYDDQGAFSRLFFSRYGISPKKIKGQTS